MAWLEWAALDVVATKPIAVTMMVASRATRERTGGRDRALDCAFGAVFDSEPREAGAVFGWESNWSPSPPTRWLTLCGRAVDVARK